MLLKSSPFAHFTSIYFSMIKIITHQYTSVYRESRFCHTWVALIKSVTHFTHIGIASTCISYSIVYESILNLTSTIVYMISGYANHLEQWRPPWGAATTSRLGSKGKYVFASRPRRSSMEIGDYNLAAATVTALPSSSNGPPTGPYLHYTTIPRRMRPLSKVSLSP